MLKVIRLFFRTREANPFFVVLCMLLSSLAEAVGIGTLLPVISIAASGDGNSNSALARAVNSLFDRVGLHPSLGVLVAIVTVFMILKAVLAYSAIAYATVSAARVSVSLRKRLVAAILDARWSYFSDQRGGKLANAIGREAAQAGEAYVAAATVVSSAIQSVAYVLIAIAISPVLALFAMITGILMTAALQHYVRRARRAGYQQTDRMAIMANYTVDLLANIKPLKTMERQAPMIERINELADKLKRSFMRREMSKAGLARGGDALNAIVAAVGIYVGSVFLKVQFADLLVSAIVFNQILSVLAKLQRQLQIAVTLESSYVRTLQIIREAEDEREVNTGTYKPDGSADTSRFENVTFSHGERTILNNVSLEIPAGAITVLSGPSGAGKTTLVDLFIGLHKVNDGRILLGGHPMQEVDLAAWRRQIGYVPQELTLFHDTVRMNLTMGDPGISDADIAAALQQAGATEFVADMPQGLDTDVGEMGGKLSGGQRQRISLARALVTKPRVLVLDEVTSALDPGTEAGIVDNIASLRGRYTIIAITHRPAWTRIADRLYAVGEGRVTEVRNKPELQPR